METHMFELLFAFGGIVLISIPVLLIYLLIAHRSLKRRVADLEQTARAGSTVFQQDAEAVASSAAKGPPKSTSEPEPAEADDVKVTGPWVGAEKAASKPVASTPSEPDGPTAAIVRDSNKKNALGIWLRENWFYAVSAVSLSLAGIFLVQYGIENGFLPPLARVIASLCFGAVLIMIGEWIRRRYGDTETSTTAHLPSTFSGAGIVTLFAGILSARLLYDLIGAETAMFGVVAVALISIVLGWFYGPLLAAVGVIGAMGAPFVVGGVSDDPSWLFGYFGLIVLVGLFVDAMRRWAWVSVISLGLGYVAAGMVFLGDPDTSKSYTIFAVVLAIAAIAVPVLRIVPNHSGAMISKFVLTRKPALPDFPTWLAAGAVIASSVILMVMSQTGSGTAQFWLAALCLVGMALALMIWCRHAAALQDLTVLPGLALLGVVVMQANTLQPVFAEFVSTYDSNPEASMPLAVTLLLGLSAAISLVAAWRSLGETHYPAHWGAFAALFAPVMAITLELTWQPAAVIGVYPWALHAAALAALMVGLATRFARADGEDRLRTAFATLSALASIAFAFVIILSSAALTVALASTVVAAAILDRRFNLPPMGWYISVGVVSLGFRLIVDPGLAWAEWAAISEVVLAYGGTLVAFVGALWILRPLDRPTPRIMLDSAAWATGGMLASLLLFRWIKASSGWSGVESHWSLALTSVIWISVALAQLQRLEIGGRMAQVRTGLAFLFGLIAAALMISATTLANPLTNADEIVLGLPLLNTLSVAYLLPALVLALGLWRLGDLHRSVQIGMSAVALALGALWLGLVIRHFWQGADGMASGSVTQAELYSYTVVLLILGAGLFYQSLARRSDVMRKAGLAVIGLAIAKVFVIDISGLGGLTRVFSLLALGLSLAGLAWLNRWAQTRFEKDGEKPV